MPPSIDQPERSLPWKSAPKPRDDGDSGGSVAFWPSRRPPEDGLAWTTGEDVVGPGPAAWSQRSRAG